VSISLDAGSTPAASTKSQLEYEFIHTVNFYIPSLVLYNNIIENLYIRNNPKYYKKLLKSINKFKSGEIVKTELIIESYSQIKFRLAKAVKFHTDFLKNYLN